jgi:hypothetical protein
LGKLFGNNLSHQVVRFILILVTIFFSDPKTSWASTSFGVKFAKSIYDFGVEDLKEKGPSGSGTGLLIGYEFESFNLGIEFSYTKMKFNRDIELYDEINETNNIYSLSMSGTSLTLGARFNVIIDPLYFNFGVSQHTYTGLVNELDYGEDDNSDILLMNSQVSSSGYYLGLTFEWTFFEMITLGGSGVAHRINSSGGLYEYFLFLKYQF